MKKIILSAVVFCSSFSAQAMIQPVDGQETHGGNIILSEFWQQHHEVTRILSQCQGAEKDPVANKWLTENKVAEVKTAPKVFVGPLLDQEVVASNNPHLSTPLIMISESLWPKLSLVEKTKITMHEVLPILGMVDSSYRYSEELYNTYYNCLVPTKSRRELTDSIKACEIGAIQRWTPAEMSLLTSTAMAPAAFAQCMPAILKLQSYGFKFGGCKTGATPESTYSYLEYAMTGYFPTNPRSIETMDFILSLSVSDLASVCDPKFVGTCNVLKSHFRAHPTDERIKVLFNKLACH